MNRNQNVAPISPMELSIVNTVRRATFPVGHSHKRFIRETSDQSKLSDRGRWFLAHIAHRYRRQYRLSTDQIRWVNDWLSKEINDPSDVPVPKPSAEPATTITEDVAPAAVESLQMSLGI